MARTKQMKVRQVIRYVSKVGINKDGAVTNDEVQEYLTALYDEGYELFSTHYLGENPEGYGMLYILVPNGYVKES